MESGAVKLIAMYDNSVSFYFPESRALTDDVEEELWDRIQARLKGFCDDLARELSTEYSVAFTASVGPEDDAEEDDAEEELGTDDGANTPATREL